MYQLGIGGINKQNKYIKPQKSGTTEGLKVATFELQQEPPSSTKGIAMSHFPQKKWVCHVRLLQKSILEKWKAKGSGMPKGKRLKSLKG